MIARIIQQNTFTWNVHYELEHSVRFVVANVDDWIVFSVQTKQQQQNLVFFSMNQ